MCRQWVRWRTMVVSAIYGGGGRAECCEYWKESVTRWSFFFPFFFRFFFLFFSTSVAFNSSGLAVLHFTQRSTTRPWRRATAFQRTCSLGFSTRAHNEPLRFDRYWPKLWKVLFKILLLNDYTKIKRLFFFYKGNIVKLNILNLLQFISAHWGLPLCQVSGMCIRQGQSLHRDTHSFTSSWVPRSHLLRERWRTQVFCVQARVLNEAPITAGSTSKPTLAYSKIDAIAF